MRIVALGDSLTTGLGLPANQAFPARLQAALKARGIAAEIADAGVSGDTAANGLARLDWAVPDKTDGVIVALGANDMLRGLDPALTRKALDEILRRLGERKIPVLLAGMRAAPNFGEDFGKRFETIYPELAAKHDVLLYPFLLDGVAADAKLNQRDGIHPGGGRRGPDGRRHPAEGGGAGRPHPQGWPAMSPNRPDRPLLSSFRFVHDDNLNR